MPFIVKKNNQIIQEICVLTTQTKLLDWTRCRLFLILAFYISRSFPNLNSIDLFFHCFTLQNVPIVRSKRLILVFESVTLSLGIHTLKVILKKRKVFYPEGARKILSNSPKRETSKSTCHSFLFYKMEKLDSILTAYFRSLSLPLSFFGNKRLLSGQSNTTSNQIQSFFLLQITNGSLLICVLSRGEGLESY